MFKKNWVKFIIMVFLFTAVTSPFVVLFGPFNNVKRAVIGAILQSRHPQYITWLFSNDELQSILGTVGVVKSQDLFKFNAREDKDLKLEKIESSRYVGYVLEIPDPRRIQV
ncbi:MAG: phosphodiester glycosidase family protein, partial [Veillonella sp.]|nr:phosphodiester glycosidase family protein [Veillonella sp.]